MREEKAIKETCIAGKTIEHVVKLRAGNHSGPRKKEREKSSEEIQKHNDRVAERNLRRLINHNFGYGDGHYTLTYQDEVNPERAQKDLEYFIRKLRKKFQEKEKSLKYIAVTEYENKRIHHHILLNTNDAALIEDLWTKGHTRASLLDKSGDYALLSNYLIKETQKTFRQPEHYRKRRFSASRNLIRPDVIRERVSVKDIYQVPEPTEGYQIIWDSVQRYENYLTGCPILEYREIKIE